jgi:hypothetical protein
MEKIRKLEAEVRKEALLEIAKIKNSGWGQGFEVLVREMQNQVLEDVEIAAGRELMERVKEDALEAATLVLVGSEVRARHFSSIFQPYTDQNSIVPRMTARRGSCTSRILCGLSTKLKTQLALRRNTTSRPFHNVSRGGTIATCGHAEQS